MLIYYCILENYKGIKKVFLGNTHLYLIPVSEERYLYLGMLGEFVGHDNCYSCRLIVDIDAFLVDGVLAGEAEVLGERFKVIETLNCQPSPAEEGGYYIKLLDEGKYIQSDLIIRLHEQQNNKSKPLYIMGGQLAFLSEPVFLKESNKEE